MIHLLIALHFFGIRIDDSFITLRYSEHFWRGQGLTWNPGQHVEGLSNALWAMLVSPLAALGHERVYAAVKIVGILFGAGAVAITYKLLYRLTQRIGPALLLSCWVAGTSPWCAWSASGMETPFYVFLLVTALLLAVMALEARSLAYAAISGLALGCAAFTRPEGGIFFGIAFVALLSRREWRPWVGMTIVGGGVIAAGIAWRLHYYHQWVPNTYYAKVGPLAIKPLALVIENYVMPFVHDVVGALGAGIVVLGMALALQRMRSHPAVTAVRSAEEMTRSPGGAAFAGLFAAAGVSAQILFTARTGGDWMPGYRFLVVILPFIAVLFAIVWIELRERIRPGLAAQRTFVAAATIAVVIHIVGTNVAFRTTASPGYYSQSWYKFPALRTSALVPVTWLDAANAVRDQTGDDELVAIDEAGYIPWALRRTYLDLYGLNDRVLGRLPRLPRLATGVILGMRSSQPVNAGERYVIDQNPAAIVVFAPRWTELDTMLGRYHRIDGSAPWALYRQRVAPPTSQPESGLRPPAH